MLTKNIPYYARYAGVVLLLSAAAAHADISGKVFRDFNANGVKDNTSTFNEIGVAGVTVTAHGASGVLGSATTAADGSYTIAGAAGAARVEFSTLPSGYYPTVASRSTVQFITAPTTDTNLGLNYPTDYVGNTDPVVVVTHQVGGHPLVNAGAGSSPSLPVMTIFNYSNRNYKTNPDGTIKNELPDGVSNLVANKQVGTVFGATYSAHSKKIFTAAFLKRHSGLGTLGSGGIYMVDPSGTFPNTTVTPFADLDSLGIQTNHPNTSDVLHVKTNDDRGLQWGDFLPTNDPSAFGQVGRVSLGDVDLSDDGRYLFVTNLYKKNVVKIDLQDAKNPQIPAAAQLQEFTITPSTCTGGEFQPFALKYHRNELYIGALCDGSTSNNVDDVTFQVIKMNPNTGANSTIFNFGSYNKSHIYGFPSKWATWLNTPTTTDAPMQPMFTDLEIDINGALIMGFADRTGHQRGHNNYQPHNNDNEDVATAGEILRAAYNAATGTYSLESNGSDGVNTTAGAGNNQGPNGGEFYLGDTQKIQWWSGNTTPVDDDHKEKSQGGLALLPGSDKVTMGTMNPKGMAWTSGVAWLSNTTGALTQDLYITDRLGKANGMGDIEILNDIPPIEIGNRVWHDIDSDGIQDADEPGIDSVEVKLFCGSSGTEWATTTTSNGGLFRFTNAAGGNALFMDYGEDCTLWVDNNQIALSTYSLTDQDADNITDNNALTDLRDSDAAPNASMAEIKFTVGKAGENNHTLDFGYKPTPNETRSIGNRIWFDTNNNGTADVGESPVGAGVKLELKNAAGDVLQSTTTDANGHYVFAGLAYSPTGYQVCLTADNFTAGGLLENYQSSTGFTDPNTTAVDGDDSGDDNESDGVCSTVVMLDHNEPTGELGIDGNYDGNDGAGTLDFLSDLTVDFGVVASTPSFPPPPGPSAMSCTADTRLATSIHVNGDSQAAGSTGAGVNGLITFDYAATGELAAPFSKGTAGQVGSVWGLAYDTTRKKLYTSAFLKRHASFGPGGVGAIYQMDGTSASATPSLLIDLAANGVDLGSSPRTPSNGVVDDPNELPADASQPSWDRDAFAQIGKISLGDIDISADGNTLWAVNLKQRELVEINLTNTTVTAKHAIPDPGCSNGEFRPWAVKVHDGKVWVGSICSAETSQQAADLKAYVQAFDGTTFTTATSFALNYPKGSVGNGPGDEKWQPWTSTFKTLASGEFAIYPQPILSDIEFDMDGSLILGFMDRMGHQVGGVNYTPNYPDDDTMTQGQTGGDMIRVCNNGGKYEPENNATCTSGSTAGKDKGQGPGNGEYYWGEMWDFNPWNADGGFHQETSFGGLAFKAGSGEIALTAMNPLNPNANAGGVIWLDNATGGRSANAGVQVYRQQGAGNPYFGKAAGMGDLEIFCAEAPPVTHSIGNRIWFDTNNNGTADSGEQHAGNGIKLELKDSTGNTVLQTTMTDANGRYLFHGLTAGNYQVCVTADNFAAGSKLEKYRSSTGQADTEVSSTDGTDRGDDDLSNGSCSTVLVLDDKEPTGEYGFTDQQDGADGQGTPDTHSNLTVDFGFVPPTDLKLTKTVDKATAKRGDMLTYTLTLSNESNTVATGVNVTDNLPAGVEIMGNPVASQGSFDKVTRIWNVGTVTANSTVTLSLSVEVK